MWWRQPTGIRGSARPSPAKPCFIFPAARAPTRRSPPRSSVHRPTLIGRLGADAFGQELRAFLAAQGVDLAFVKDTAEAHTGTAIITIANADNTIVVVPGANALVSAEDVAAPVLAKGDVAVSQFEIPLPAITAFFKRARAAGATTILNPAPAIALRPRVARSRRYPHPQRDRAWASRAAPSFTIPTSPHASSKRHGRLPTGTDKIICVTLGKRGVLALVDGEPLADPGPRGEGRRHHRRRRLLRRRARGAACRRKGDPRRARIRQCRRIDLRAADGRGAVDADRGRGGCRYWQSRDFVGWAKRSVPTISDHARMVGTRERLCPPYEVSTERTLQIETRIRRLLRRDRAVGGKQAPSEHVVAGAVDRTRCRRAVRPCSRTPRTRPAARSPRTTTRS